LQSIAELECKDFPSVKEALLYQTYVDHICVGGDTLDEAISLQDGLIHVLHSAGMVFKKWASNVPAILDKVPPRTECVNHCRLMILPALGQKTVFIVLFVYRFTVLVFFIIFRVLIHTFYVVCLGAALIGDGGGASQIAARTKIRGTL